MKSKALIETERNIKRMNLGMTDPEFSAMLRRQEVVGKRAEIALAILAVFTVAVCVYDPLAKTLALGLEYVAQALGVA